MWLAAATTLTGCGDLFEPTISEICESHSEICLDLSLDARCRGERAEIIRLRYYNQDSKDDAYKYPLLLNFEEYLTCVEEVQHIEHVKRKGKVQPYAYIQFDRKMLGKRRKRDAVSQFGSVLPSSQKRSGGSRKRTRRS